MVRQMKKLLSLGLSFAMLLVCFIPFGAGAATDQFGRTQSEQYIVDTYNKYFAQYNGDAQQALMALLNSKDSLELVNNEIIGYKMVDGELLAVNPYVRSESQSSDITFTDSIVHDRDWGTYVYTGTWNWKKYPVHPNPAPYDMVGFYTQDASQVRGMEFFVSGYNQNGALTAYYNTDTGKSSGPIQKGIDAFDGTAFWIDENTVRYGNIIVPLYYNSGSNSAKIMTQYAHSWTSTTLTGIGGQINFASGGGGFNVNWQSNVSSWGHTASSSGVKIP